MTGQHIGQTAHLTPAHGVGLPGDRERTHPDPPDPARREMTIQDRVHLVRARGRLVHTLGKDRDDLLGPAPQIEKGPELGLAQPRGRQIVPGGGNESLLKSGDVFGKGVVDLSTQGDFIEQPVEQRHVATRRDGKVQVGPVAGRGAARVDHHQLGATLFARRDDPLIQNRMTPCEVRAGENDQIGLFQIFIGAGHRIGPEGPLVPRHGRGHAQARVGVDVRRAEEPFGQLVRDVIILGQQLTRDIERHAIGAVLGDGVAEPLRDQIKRLVPTRRARADARAHQPVVQPKGLAKLRTFGAQLAPVRRMRRVALDLHPALPVGAKQHAATHPAIGAGRADLRQARPVHQAALLAASSVMSRNSRPPSTRIG